VVKYPKRSELPGLRKHLPGKDCRLFQYAWSLRIHTTVRLMLILRNVLQVFLICTEEKIVSKHTRLETVHKLRETEEDRARLAMADAQRHVAAATDALSAARARASLDERRSASAAHWSIIESAHTRALQEARQAERAVQTASDGLSKSRAHYIGAHTKTEALRRAIETRRAEMTRAEAQAEKKTMDEIAMLLHSSAA
jgi:flagellar export protein FliJ